MDCPACNAFAGGNRPGTGGFQGVQPQSGVPSVEELLESYAEGVSLSDDRIALAHATLSSAQRSSHAAGRGSPAVPWSDPGDEPNWTQRARACASASKTSGVVTLASRSRSSTGRERSTSSSASFSTAMRSSAETATTPSLRATESRFSPPWPAADTLGGSTHDAPRRHHERTHR